MSIRYISIRKDDLNLTNFHLLIRTWKFTTIETDGAYIFQVTSDAMADGMVKGQYGNATELTAWLGVSNEN